MQKTRARQTVRTESTRRGLDMDKAAQKQREVKDRTSGDFMELKEDEWAFFYILPPWSDEQVLWKEVEQHGILVCPKRANGKDCIVCDEMVKRGRKGDSDFVDQYRLRSRAFFNAVRKDDLKKLLSTPAAVVKVLAVSTSVFREILEYINDEGADISDPQQAVAVAIKRRGKGIRTRYKVKFGQPVDISGYVTSKALDVLHDLDALRAAQPASIKDMRKAIRGAADEDEDFAGDEIDQDLEEGEEDIDTGSEEDELFDEPGDDEGDTAEEPEDVYDTGEGSLDEGDEEYGADEAEPEPPPRRVRPAARRAAAITQRRPAGGKPRAVADRVRSSLKKPAKVARPKPPDDDLPY